MGYSTPNPLLGGVRVEYPYNYIHRGKVMYNYTLPYPKVV